jgi:hypothetical protein
MMGTQLNVMGINNFRNGVALGLETRNGKPAFRFAAK